VCCSKHSRLDACKGRQWVEDMWWWGGGIAPLGKTLAENKKFLDLVAEVALGHIFVNDQLHGLLIYYTFCLSAINLAGTSPL
jgi:hypothetical protein